MKLVTHLFEGNEQLALLVNNSLYHTQQLNPSLPSTMKGFLSDWDKNLALAQKAETEIAEGKHTALLEFRFSRNFSAGTCPYQLQRWLCFSSTRGFSQTQSQG
jgi:hypothetical protein